MTAHNFTHDQSSSSYMSSAARMHVQIMLVAMVLMILLVAATHLCVRWVWWAVGGTTTDHVQVFERVPEGTAAAGLDKIVLDELPAFVYTKENMKETVECSVCISEFQENETGRLLPICNHHFHTACIDVWFLSHSTCPLCRATVGEESILHDDVHEDMHVDKEVGVQTIPHSDTVELSCAPNYGNVAKEQIGTNYEDLLKNSFGMQATSSDQQHRHEHPNSCPHMKLEKVNPSTQYPGNTLFYGNENLVSSESSCRAERIKKLEHLVIEVSSAGSPIYPFNSVPRTTPPTPSTPISGRESIRTPLSHLKTIKRILSMRDQRRSVVPAKPKSSTDHFNRAVLTP